MSEFYDDDDDARDVGTPVTYQARSTVERSDQQEEAARRIVRWFEECRARRRAGRPIEPFYLGGYAGTGKTTLAQGIARELGGNWLFAAYTGKAALVLRRRGCHGAQTIHSMIYRPDGSMADRIDESGRRILSWKIWDESPLLEAPGVILDECSMADTVVGRDLLSFGRPILALGDPAQLPPVSGTGFFVGREPDYLLTEIHRQARDSGILELATHVRQGGAARDVDGWSCHDCEVVDRANLVAGADSFWARLLRADQVIVGTNDTRRWVNQRYREEVGRRSPWPERGERVVCLRNNREHGLLNGSMWRVESAVPSDDKNTLDLSIYPDDEPSEGDGGESRTPVRVRAWAHHFAGRHDELGAVADPRAYQEFDWGYAITCHKAQGSQWPRVVVIDESASFRKDASRWLYTAITRASERLEVLL